MKTRHRQQLLVVALACAFGATTADAHTEPGFYRPLTLAPADATSSGGDGARGEAGDQQAELAKKPNNPISSLISFPIQNNWASTSARRMRRNTRPTSSRSFRFR